MMAMDEETLKANGLLEMKQEALKCDAEPEQEHEKLDHGQNKHAEVNPAAPNVGAVENVEQQPEEQKEKKEKKENTWTVTPRKTRRKDDCDLYEKVMQERPKTERELNAFVKGAQSEKMMKERERRRRRSSTRSCTCPRSRTAACATRRRSTRPPRGAWCNAC